MGDEFWYAFSMQDIVYLLIGIMSIAMWIMYRRHVKAEKQELLQLKAFLSFLDSMVYQYTIFQCVEEAILESLEETTGQLQEMMEEVYHLLLLEDTEEVRLHKKKNGNPFYYEFLIFSYLAMEYGDDAHNSVYLYNLSFLKQEIFIWILDREKLMHFLLGLVFLVLFPIQFLKLIELWANYNLPDLVEYYRYGYGTITRLLLLFCTVICYMLLLGLRNNYEVMFYKSNLLVRVSKMRYIKRYFTWWMEHHPKKVRRLTELLRKSSARITMIELCLIRTGAASLAALLSSVILIPVWKQDTLSLVSTVLTVLLFVALFYNIPVWYIALRIQLMQKEKEDEVYFFYGIVIMMAGIEKGDVDDILEWLDLAGGIFSPALQDCIDEYAYDNKLALEHAKLAEPFTPFMKLMDALEMSEQVGMRQAVYPLKMEQEHYIEKRKQDNMIWTENKGALGRFVAFIPMVGTIGLYLIIPFVLESIIQLKEYIEQIQTAF